LGCPPLELEHFLAMAADLNTHSFVFMPDEFKVRHFRLLTNTA
jgi:hypothetical protein